MSRSTGKRRKFKIMSEKIYHVGTVTAFVEEWWRPLRVGETIDSPRRMAYVGRVRWDGGHRRRMFTGKGARDQAYEYAYYIASVVSDNHRQNEAYDE